MKHTKKLGIGLLAVTLVTVLGCTTAFASGHGHGWYSAGNTCTSPHTCCSGSGYCLRDTDGDGVLDAWSAPCTDADGNGICGVCGRTAPTYADANGDGVCDHFGIGSAGGAAHRGSGHHHGGRWGGTWTSA